MSFISSIRTRYLAWSQSTPLPDLPDTPLPAFQRWHAFDKASCKWAPVEHGHLEARRLSQSSTPTSQPPTLQLLTWNIDAFADHHEARMDGILSRLQQAPADGGGGPDIVFLQEVSRKAFSHLIQSAWVREHWVSSEADETNWAGVPFATMILLSRSRLGIDSKSNPENRPESAQFSLGPLWRVKYTSRFGRDALCCDLFWGSTTRLRLINVHLDSLACHPNHRPRQVALAAGLLRATGVGRGVIAGDWNPVSEEDATLVQENRLVDAWEKLRPGEDGFTWGLDGKGAPFPARRMDKVAMLGLEPVGVGVVHPDTLSLATDPGEGRTTDSGEEGVAWSDHSGLLCSFTLGDTLP